VLNVFSEIPDQRGDDMKLRIKGNSIRLRLLRPEVACLIDSGLVEETIYLGLGDQSAFTYALAIDPGLAETQLRYKPPKLAILLPKGAAATWAETDQVGIYAAVEIEGHGTLDLIVEKDFACLDLSDADNRDTFPNPEIGAVC
jgi:hypothetical protein